MELRSYPNETLMLMQAIAIRQKDMIVAPIYKTTIEGNNYISKKLDEEQHILLQDIVIADQALHSKCTSAEWHLIGRITCDIYMNNCLWYCDKELKNNSTVKKAIKGLLNKQILWKTSITNFYFINPQHIRRGKELEVLYTTGQAIFENNGIDTTLLTNKRAIRDFDFSKQSINSQQIGYGYSADNYSESENTQI